MERARSFRAQAIQYHKALRVREKRELFTARFILEVAHLKATELIGHAIVTPETSGGNHAHGGGEHRCAGVHHHQHCVCHCDTPGDQCALVGASCDLRGLVVGREGAMGKALNKR